MNQNQSKSVHLQSFDEFFRLDAKKGTAYQSFRFAYDLESQSHSGQSGVEIAHAYWDAFMGGVPEAGVNLLRILMLIHLQIHSDSDKSYEFPFQERIEIILNELRRLDHPAGRYYEALGLIYGAFKSDAPPEKAADLGLSLMYNLAALGNEYAAAWVADLEYPSFLIN